MYKDKTKRGQAVHRAPTPTSIYTRIAMRVSATKLRDFVNIHCKEIAPYSMLKLMEDVRNNTFYPYQYHPKEFFEQKTRIQKYDRVLIPLPPGMLETDLHPAIVGPLEKDLLVAIYLDDKTHKKHVDGFRVDWDLIRRQLGFKDGEEIKCKSCRYHFDLDKIRKELHPEYFTSDICGMISCSIWYLHTGNCNSDFQIPEIIGFPDDEIFAAVGNSYKQIGEMEREFDFNELKKKAKGWDLAQCELASRGFFQEVETGYTSDSSNGGSDFSSVSSAGRLARRSQPKPDYSSDSEESD